jgi:hypothetical protein
MSQLQVALTVVGRGLLATIFLMSAVGNKIPTLVAWLRSWSRWAYRPRNCFWSVPLFS